MTRLAAARLALASVLAAAALTISSCSSDNSTTGVTGTIALALSSNAATVAPGGQAVVVGTVTRSGGFTGDVAVTATGAPTGVTATVGTVTTVGLVSTATVTLNIGAGVAVGVYPITVSASGTGVTTVTKTYTLTVATGGGGGGNAVANFSGCAGGSVPIWFAYQDGVAGTWTVATPTNGTYTWAVTQPKGGFAYVAQTNAGVFQTNVVYYTNTELTSAPFVFCTLNGTNSMTGTVAGLSAGLTASTSLGGGATQTTFPTTAFTINNIKSGTFDLLSYRTNITTGPAAGDRLIIRRNQLVANAGTIALLDFGAGEAVAPASGTVTLTNGGTTNTAQMTYYTTGCTPSGSLYLMLNPTSPFTIYGVPAASQIAADYHALFVGTTTGTDTRGVLSVFHTMGNQTIAMPTAITAPVVTSLGGNYKRLQAVLTLPAEYNGGATFSYFDGTASHSANVTATFGWLGGTAATIAFPTFTGLTGWLDTYAPATAAAVTTGITATGVNMPTGGICQEGYRVVTDNISGTN